MERSAVSVPSNIAEGYELNSDRGFVLCSFPSREIKKGPKALFYFFSIYVNHGTLLSGQLTLLQNLQQPQCRREA